MAYTVFVFDLDGTLIDTSPGILQSARIAEKQMGYPPVTDAQLKTIIGPPLWQSFADLYQRPAEEIAQLIDIYRKHYWQDGVKKSAIYPGMLELLQSLKGGGYKLAIATMKLERYTHATLEPYAIEPYFDSIAAYDEEHHPSKCDLILRTLAQMGVTDKSTVLMIGDSIYDSEGAKDAGVDFAAMTGGFGFPDDATVNRYPSVCKAENVQQLAKFINKNLG